MLHSFLYGSYTIIHSHLHYLLEGMSKNKETKFDTYIANVGLNWVG